MRAQTAQSRVFFGIGAADPVRIHNRKPHPPNLLNPPCLLWDPKTSVAFVGFVNFVRFCGYPDSYPYAGTSFSNRRQSRLTSSCQRDNASSIASSTGRILMPARSSLVTSRIQLDRGAFAER